MFKIIKIKELDRPDFDKLKDGLNFIKGYYYLLPTDGKRKLIKSDNILDLVYCSKKYGLCAETSSYLYLTDKKFEKKLEKAISKLLKWVEKTEGRRSQAEEIIDRKIKYQEIRSEIKNNIGNILA